MIFRSILTGLLTILVVFTLKAQDVSLEWVHGIGGFHNLDNGRGIVTDAQGNLYVTGSFGDTVDFDPGSGATNLGSFTSAAGNSEGFVAKYDTDGNLLWAKQTHTTSASGPYPFQNTWPNSIVLDNQGNILISGFSGGGATDFDPGSGTAELNADAAHNTFVWKLDQDGNFIWIKKLGGTGEDGALAIDDSNNIYITGHFQQTADFNPGTAVNNMSPTAAIENGFFLCKLDSNGSFQWAVQQPASDLSGEKKSGIALDADGNIFLAGTFRGLAEDFDPGPNTVILSSGSETNSQTSVSKWNSSGLFQWVKTFQNGSDSLISYTIGADTFKRPQKDGSKNLFGAITIDEGNIIIGGSFRTNGPLRPDFDPGTGTVNFPLRADSIYTLRIRANNPNRTNFTPGVTQGSYIIKLNGSGELTWAKELFDDSIGNGVVEHNCIRTDHSGNIYSAGYFSNGKIDFNPGAAIADTFYLMRSTGAFHFIPFILKLSGAGNFTWAKQFEVMLGPGNMVRSMSVGQAGSIYTTGAYSAFTDFDPGANTLLIIPNGATDMFLHKMSCSDTTGNTTIYDTAICRYPYGDTVYTESGTYYQ